MWHKWEWALETTSFFQCLLFALSLPTPWEARWGQRLPSVWKKLHGGLAQATCLPPSYSIPSISALRMEGEKLLSCTSEEHCPLIYWCQGRSRESRRPNQLTTAWSLTHGSLMLHISSIHLRESGWILLQSLEFFSSKRGRRLWELVEGKNAQLLPDNTTRFHL